MEQVQKNCNKCGLVKPVSEFYRYRTDRSSGIRNTCKGCHKEAGSANYRNNKDKVLANQRERSDVIKQQGRTRYANNPNRTRGYKFKYKYGITWNDYVSMYESQDGRCKICRLPGMLDGDRSTRLAVDHCHTSGAVRGLLCRKCNSMLGLAGDSPSTLQAAIDYINTTGTVIIGGGDEKL